MFTVSVVTRRLCAAVLGSWSLLLSPAIASGAVDPGPRAGPAGAGGAIGGLTADEGGLFDAGLDAFGEHDTVQGDRFFPGTDAGLGPRFNLDSCAGCHAHPAVGGTSPALNPQVALATAAGARNRVPWFVAAQGPVREARFVRKPDGSPDGGVAAIFVVSGRVDAGACSIAQPDFGLAGDPITGQGGNPNLIFRIPTPTFGAGLVEAIPDRAIVANLRSQGLAKLFAGISGHENRSGNDGTITRFGWKAQNKSLVIFSGEAYNVEQGISNELFMNEREEDPACTFTGAPEDTSGLAADASGHSDVVKFGAFMRFLDAPAPGPTTRSTLNGRAVFDRVGCGLCHTPTLRTGRSSSAALSNRAVNLFSDLALHDMGTALADGVSQGGAGPREFRSAPLWGVGQRLFFLHDGRTSDLLAAIRAHASPGSEANVVVARFLQQPDADRQDLLNFLRSL